MINILIGSPRQTNSTSYYLSTLLKLEATYAYVRLNDFSILSEDQSMIIACPVYIDGLPAEMLSYLEDLSSYLKDHPINLKVYALITCGFPEGHQTHIALDIIRLFCQQNNLSFMGGLGVGGGEFMLNSQTMPLEVPIKKAIGLQLKLLSEAINKGACFETTVTQPKMPKVIFKLMATHHWHQVGKKNGLSKKDMRKAVE